MAANAARKSTEGAAIKACRGFRSADTTGGEVPAAQLLRVPDGERASISLRFPQRKPAEFET
jgi:hypothetical protein